MPGNIRVAVLEATDLPSTVTDGKSVAVKVSVGRREFQTSSVEPQDGRTQPWNLEYLFPVLNLRDNLLLSLLDSKGDVVARAELETPGIVQKGFQDSFIALKAGGRIHVKVSFVLSEEERRKIEAMRLAATKKRKGLGQSFKSRRANVSNVKITEISSEEADNMDTTAPQVIPRVDSKDEDANGLKAEKLDELSREHSAPKSVPATVPKPDLPPKNCDVKAPVVTAATETPTPASPASNPAAAEAGSKSESSRRKIFNWLSRRQHENRIESGVEKAVGDDKWLEDLKLKSQIDTSTSAKAAKADEWIKNLDRSNEKAGSMRSKKQSQEEEKRRDQAKDSQKTVKQKLEDWRAKELGPWRRTSKVRHASPPGSEHGTRWSLKHGTKHRIEKELSSAQHPELVAAADKLWASTLQQESASSGNSSPSSSPANHRKVSGAVKNLVKQVLSGAAVVAGAIVMWPRRGSSRIKERYHVVQEGETLSSIIPGEWEDPDSNFYRLNPQIRDKHVIYPGQRIRLS